MLQFSVPLAALPSTGAAYPFYHFATRQKTVLLAGSRSLELEPRLALGLVKILGSLGAHFYTGCAQGVDASFRKALGQSPYAKQAFVGCAFHSRAKIMRLPAQKVVPDGLPARVALAKRTLWLTHQAGLLLLFPALPAGPGSALAFSAMIKANKPVFVVRQRPPAYSSCYRIYPSSLFGLVRGYWVLPQMHTSRPGDRKTIRL